MAARRVDPMVRNPRYGLCELPSGRIVFVTNSGLEVGSLPPQPQPARDPGVHAERLQDSLLWGRPLAHDQIWVTALCVAGRRP